MDTRSWSSNEPAIPYGPSFFIARDPVGSIRVVLVLPSGYPSKQRVAARVLPGVPFCIHDGHQTGYAIEPGAGSSDTRVVLSPYSDAPTALQAGWDERKIDESGVRFYLPNTGFRTQYGTVTLPRCPEDFGNHRRQHPCDALSNARFM